MKTREVGDIGERLAIQHLLNEGFQVARFGKEMHRQKARDDLPVVPDLELGYSHGNFQTFTIQGVELDWQDSNIPEWADTPYETIQSCAKICKAHSDCSIRDSDPANAPCANIPQFLEREWLSSITPSFDSIVSDDKGNPIPFKGHRVVFKCLQNILLIALGQHLSQTTSTTKSNFILNNMIVTKYIQNYWQNWSMNNPLPYSSSDIGDAIQSGNPEKAEALKEKNRLAMKQFPGHGEHPGRYDLMAYKEGELFAIEVKVNSSPLSYWQKVRLKCLQLMGHKVKVIRVGIGKGAIPSLDKKAKQHSITESDHIDTTGIEIPTLVQLLEIADMHYLRGERISLREHYTSLISD